MSYLTNTQTKKEKEVRTYTHSYFRLVQVIGQVSQPELCTELQTCSSLRPSHGTGGGGGGGGGNQMKKELSQVEGERGGGREGKKSNEERVEKGGRRGRKRGKEIE